MRYGNPSADIYKLSHQSTFLDSLFTDLSQLTYAEPDSTEVKTELEKLVSLTEDLTANIYLAERYRLFDRSLFQYVHGLKLEFDETLIYQYRDLVKSVFNDVVPLIAKLKMHYQRPRPFQLAALHEVPLYPFASYSAQCPAFPSLYACMGKVLAEVIGNRFPPLVSHVHNLSADLYQSRMYLGVCLPADLEAGLQAASRITGHREFKIKYKL